MTESVHSQVTSRAGWSDQNYGYDATGRLTMVEDTTETVCTRRSYAFDARSNRKSLATATPGTDCPTTGGAAANSTYDSGDRLVNSGYTYDAFSRTTALPGSTVGYYANDLAYQQISDGKRQTWQLDAALRFRSWKVETGSRSTWTQTASKLNHSSPATATTRWIVEDTATGALSRNVVGASGDLAATTLYRRGHGVGCRLSPARPGGRPRPVSRSRNPRLRSSFGCRVTSNGFSRPSRIAAS